MINEILNTPLRIGFSHNNKVNPHYLIDDKGVKVIAVDTNAIERLSLTKIALALNMFDLVIKDLEDATYLLTKIFTEDKASEILDEDERKSYLKTVRHLASNNEYLNRLREEAN